MNAIEIKNLRKNLGNFSLKIDDLKVPEGFVTGFIGPNGSGKTTTIKLIMNMINKDQGTIKMWGKDYKINDLTIKEKIVFHLLVLSLHFPYIQYLQVLNFSFQLNQLFHF